MDRGGVAAVKGLLKVGVLGFGVALGVVVGSRLSGEATALALGVVLGVLAGLPMGGLVLMLVRRGEGARPQVVHEQRYPPVVVVNPGIPAGVRSDVPYLAPAGEYPPQRQFKIIGEETMYDNG
jgi:hypothetical protein